MIRFEPVTGNGIVGPSSNYNTIQTTSQNTRVIMAAERRTDESRGSR